MKTKQTVLVVGSLNMDLVVSASRLPSRGETISGSGFATFPGGKGANQAVAAGKLGAIVMMVGCVGRDSFAENLISSLKAGYVHTERIRKVHASTGTALITVGDDGANTIVVVGGANRECKPEDVKAALACHAEPGILLVQNEVSPDTVEYSIRAAKERGWLVIYNPAPARKIDGKVLALTDIVIPNETEVSLLTDVPVGGVDEIIKAAQYLLEMGVKHVIVTMGDKGALLCNASGHKQVKAYQVTAVDTTAAGDAYTGALAASLAEGKNLIDSMNFAAAAAAVSVTRKGAQPSLPSQSEVEAFIKQQERRE